MRSLGKSFRAVVLATCAALPAAADAVVISFEDTANTVCQGGSGYKTVGPSLTVGLATFEEPARDIRIDCSEVAGGGPAHIMVQAGRTLGFSFQEAIQFDLTSLQVAFDDSGSLSLIMHLTGVSNTEYAVPIDIDDDGLPVNELVNVGESVVGGSITQASQAPYWQLISVEVNNSVPEPGTAALLAAGGFLTWQARRRGQNPVLGLS